MKSIKAVTAAVLLGSGVITPAMAEVTGNLGVASQYIFRGLSFGDPQVSGGIDWASGGLYAGSWISSANGEQEVDFYGGWANDFVDVGYIYYYFPGTLSGTADAAEVYASLSFGPASVSAWYAPSGFTGVDDDEYAYVEANLDVGLSDKASLGLHVGATENLGEAYDNDPDTTFLDYALTLNFGDLFVMASMIDYDSAATGQLENEPTFTVGYSWSFEDIL